MGKSKKKVEIVFLACEETGDLNYTIRRKTGGEKLKLMKYSPAAAKAHAARREEEAVAAGSGIARQRTACDGQRAAARRAAA